MLIAVELMSTKGIHAEIKTRQWDSVGRAARDLSLSIKGEGVIEIECAKDDGTPKGQILIVNLGEILYAHATEVTSLG
jgi:hypothetical protein